MGAGLGAGGVGPRPSGAGPLGAGPSWVRQGRQTSSTLVSSKKFLCHHDLECGKNERRTRSGALVRCSLDVFCPPLQTLFLDYSFLGTLF